MLVIYSKLNISTEGREWIEAIRRRHDPQHHFIPAHFTFVFPFSGLAADDVLTAAGPVVDATPPIRFRLSRAAGVKDPLDERSRLFLLPTEGADEMVALNARLYAGCLAAHRHPTLQFRPHVTVGAFSTQQDAETAAADLDRFDIPGELESLFLADFDGHAIADLHELRFGH